MTTFSFTINKTDIEHTIASTECKSSHDVMILLGLSAIAMEDDNDPVYYLDDIKDINYEMYTDLLRIMTVACCTLRKCESEKKKGKKG